jgi:hypothetical protein
MGHFVLVTGYEEEIKIEETKEETKEETQDETKEETQYETKEETKEETHEETHIETKQHNCRYVVDIEVLGDQTRYIDNEMYLAEINQQWTWRTSVETSKIASYYLGLEGKIVPFITIAVPKSEAVNHCVKIPIKYTITNIDHGLEEAGELYPHPTYSKGFMGSQHDDGGVRVEYMESGVVHNFDSIGSGYEDSVIFMYFVMTPTLDPVYIRNVTITQYIDVEETKNTIASFDNQYINNCTVSDTKKSDNTFIKYVVAKHKHYKNPTLEEKLNEREFQLEELQLETQPEEESHSEL